MEIAPETENFLGKLIEKETLKTTTTELLLAYSGGRASTQYAEILKELKPKLAKAQTDILKTLVTKFTKAAVKSPKVLVERL